jgi:hypothetical protein
MMKKVLSLFIVTVLLFNVVSVKSFADVVDNTGDGNYTILDFWNDLKERLGNKGNRSFGPENNVFNPDVSSSEWWEGLMNDALGGNGFLSMMPEDLVNGLGGSAKDLAEWISDVFTPWWIKNKGTGVVEVPDMPYLRDHQYYLSHYGGVSGPGNSITPDPSIRYTYYFNASVINFIDNGDIVVIYNCSNVVRELFNANYGDIQYINSTDDFVTFKKSLFISSNYPFTSANSEAGIFPVTPPTYSPKLDITTMTPDEYEDLLEELDKQMQIYINIEFPDLTSIKGLLENIRALLADAANKGITAEDLQKLAESLGCKCPTVEDLNAAILTLMGEDEKDLTDIINVLLDIKEGDKGLDDIYDQLKLINSETNVDNFLVAIDPLDTEFVEKFPNVVDSILNLISGFRGVGEYSVINTLITTFQSILLFSNYQPIDISFNLSFLGVESNVVILRAADFVQGGRLYQGLQTAKQLVSIFLVVGWLMLMRKKYLLMFEIASNS